MLTIGQDTPVAVCKLSCTGQGPIISYQPTVMDFGDVNVLEEKIMKLEVISDAPIPARFNIALVSRNRFAFVELAYITDRFVGSLLFLV